MILHINQIFEIADSFWTINLKRKKNLKNHLCTHRSDKIRGLVAIKLRRPALNNGNDISQMFDGTAHGYQVLPRNVRVSFVDGGHRHAALMDLSKRDGTNPCKSVTLLVSLLAMRNSTVISTRPILLYGRSCTDRASLVLLDFKFRTRRSSF